MHVRSSKYNDLKYVVECRYSGSAGYEPIAAFNVESVACGYAQTASFEKHRHGYTYRVTERLSGGKFKTIADYPAS